MLNTTNSNGKFLRTTLNADEEAVAAHAANGNNNGSNKLFQLNLESRDQSFNVTT